MKHKYPVCMLFLIAMTMLASIVQAAPIFNCDFNDKNISGWNSSDVGMWSTISTEFPAAANYKSDGNPNWIEHPIALNSNTWSLVFDANWLWGSGNGGLWLSVGLSDDQNNGYRLRIIQNGDCKLIKVNKGVEQDSIASANIGPIGSVREGGGSLRSFRLNRSDTGEFALEHWIGTMWVRDFRIVDIAFNHFTRIRLQEDTGKGCAIFDNINILEKPTGQREFAGAPAPQQSLMPMKIERFFVEPNKPTELIFRMVRTPNPFFGGSFSYAITDFQGIQVAAGQAIYDSGMVRLPVTLKQGYYELSFTSTGQSFGIQSIPPSKGKPDKFFGIDSSMSWFVKPELGTRQPMINLLKRNGIAFSRERLAWSQIEPNKNKWEWDGQNQYTSLRKQYANTGINLLDMCEITPDWNAVGPDAGCIQNLNQTVKSWQTIAEKWSPYLTAFEIWNEPDNNMFFNNGGLDRGRPADQYVQLAKAVTYAFHKANSKTELVGGTLSISCLGPEFVMSPSAFHRLDAQNGLLELLDGVSFHSYSPAATIESEITGMRGWFAKSGKPAMRLWLTECGTVPWADGYTLTEQATGVAMKAVESKACGVYRHFLFLYPYFPGGADWLFGVMNWDGTPGYLMATYVQAVHALSNMNYIGDLNCKASTLKRARIFGNDKQTVVVLFTGKVDPDAKLDINLNAQRINGADGRLLKLDKSGVIPIPDGLTYAFVKRSDVSSRLITNTHAMQLLKASQGKMPKRLPPSPIVIQPLMNLYPKLYARTYTGYRILEQADLSKLPISTDVYNLSDKPQNITLKITNPDFPDKLLGSSQITVPANYKKREVFLINIESQYQPGRTLVIAVNAQGKNAGKTTPLVVYLKPELSLAELQKHFISSGSLPVKDLNSWSGKGDFKSVSLDQDTLRSDFKTAGGECIFALPKDTDISKIDGFLVRAKCSQAAKIWFSIMEKTNNYPYRFPTESYKCYDGQWYPSETLIHPDNEWHTVYVPLSAMKPFDDSKKPDTKLNPNGVNSISFGLINMGSPDNSLSISDIICVKKK